MLDAIALLNQFIELINNIPNNSDSYWERLVIWIIISYLELKLYMLELAYDLAAQIISAVGLSEAIQSAWSSLPPATASTLTYLRVPEAINMIMSAYVTRFILGLMP